MEGKGLPESGLGDAGSPKARRIAGLLAAAAVGAVAWGLHHLFPAFSAAILAIVLGAIVRNTLPLPASLIEDCKGLVKRVIPITIILTGASVNLGEVARVGAPALAVVVAAIIFGGSGAFAAGRLLTTSRHT